LTGNAQMALLWLRLYRLGGDGRFLNAALKALDLVMQAQPVFSSSPDIRGGIPGSYPVWGDYIYLGLPNWAAKFFVDALMEKKSVLEHLVPTPCATSHVPGASPAALPPAASPLSPKPLNVIMYTARGSCKVQHMIGSWSEWGFRPSAVVVERRPGAGWAQRLRDKIAEDGLSWLLRRLLPRAGAPSRGAVEAGHRYPDLEIFCKQRNIPIVSTHALDSDEALAVVRTLEPDLAIHAGAGILRAPLLRIPRLGTLNAHMGILPRYRGMNAAEWAYFEMGLAGCSVHLIDPGIDSGDILCVRRVDVNGAEDVQALRDRVDDAQIDLLGEVLRYIILVGTLPPRRRQAPGEGRQFFRMHPQLKELLARRLRGAGLRPTFPRH
jgi:folate-dependent phosphoribosylglycinamide formyltransferase PurN